MTAAPDQSGGQRAADNQQQAFNALMPRKTMPGMTLDDLTPAARAEVDRIAAALDAAEVRGIAIGTERGRAEVAAKVEALLADGLTRHFGVGYTLDRLRALVAEVTAPAGQDEEAGR